MSLSHESEYSSLRAYAVKLRSAARPDVLAGRFESIVTDRRRASRTPWSLVPAPRVFAAALIATGVASCATPMLESSFQPPGQFAAASASEEQADTAWWESYDDPVLSELIRRAASENRDVKIAAERVRAARAGETISRSWLLPSIGAHGRRLRSPNRLRLATSSETFRRPRTRRAGGRRRRLLGNRPRRSPARGGHGRGGRRAGGGRRREGRAPAGADRRRNQLLHARRRAAPARQRARDIGRARRDAAPRDRRASA